MILNTTVSNGRVQRCLCLLRTKIAVILRVPARVDTVAIAPLFRTPTGFAASIDSEAQNLPNLLAPLTHWGLNICARHHFCEKQDSTTVRG